MDEEIIYKIIPRHDISTNWTLNNPILALGEYGVEDDTHKVKRGDGVTPWVKLQYETLGIEKTVEEYLNDSFVHIEEGKTLTSNDFTDDDKAKLDSLKNYNDTEVKELISTNTQNIEANKQSISVNADNIQTETTIRQSEVTNLQTQIDAITSASDVTDIVNTYSDLENYETTKLTDKDIIKVLADETHDNATSYYRWIKTEESGSWNYIGSQGPTYTKSETDTLLNNKQNNITNESMLNAGLVDDTNTAHKFTTTEDITKLSNIENNAQVNVLESISVNGTDLTATDKKVNITVPTTDDINSLIDAKIALITNAEEVQY